MSDPSAWLAVLGCPGSSLLQMHSSIHSYRWTCILGWNEEAERSEETFISCTRTLLLCQIEDSMTLGQPVQSKVDELEAR